MITPNAHIAAMASYALADLSATGDDARPIVSLAQNESAFPASPLALEAARAALVDAPLYPDPDWTELRNALAKTYDVDAQNTLCGAGSMELIDCLMRCYAGPGDHVLSSEFGYAFFRTAAQAVGAGYDTAPELEMTVSVDRLLEVVHDRTRIVCVANPGNPTGTLISRQELVRLRDGLADDILLIIDEAYGEFSDALEERTFDLVARGNTVVLRTLSKAYGLAGMRVGWGVFPSDTAGEIRKVLNPNNISVASAAAARAAVLDQDYMRMVCVETAARRDRFAEQLRILGLTPPESHTNFVLIPFADASACVCADAALRTAGIVMRGMAGYGLPQCLRATIGTEEAMERAMECLAQWSEKEPGS